MKQQKKDFLKQYNYFVYDFTNTETGENYSYGNIKENSVYKMTFDEATHFTSFRETEHIYLSDYLEGHEGIGLLGTVEDIHVDSASFVGTVAIPKALIKKTEHGQSLVAFQFTKYGYYGLFGLGDIEFYSINDRIKANLEKLYGMAVNSKGI